MTHTTSCPHCDHEFDVEIEPYVPARTYGPPELCYPAEGGGVEPERCPNCDGLLGLPHIYEQWADEQAALNEPDPDSRPRYED